MGWKEQERRSETGGYVTGPVLVFRHENGAKVSEEKDHQAEELPERVQHLPLPVALPVHHQHVRDRLRNRRLLHLCSGVRAGGRSV